MVKFGAAYETYLFVKGEPSLLVCHSSPLSSAMFRNIFGHHSDVCRAKGAARPAHRFINIILFRGASLLLRVLAIFVIKDPSSVFDIVTIGLRRFAFDCCQKPVC